MTNNNVDDTKKKNLDMLRKVGKTFRQCVNASNNRILDNRQIDGLESMRAPEKIMVNELKYIL
jgi:hypothetical protein